MEPARAIQREQTLIQPHKPIIWPLLPGRSSRRQPSITKNKFLFLESPGALKNDFGERFDISLDSSTGGRLINIQLKSKERGPGKLKISIEIFVFEDDDKVKISAIKNESETNPRLLFSKPAKVDSGYGVMRFALAYAKYIARRRGISKVTIIPSSPQLEVYYKRFGFREQPLSENHMNLKELVLRLEQ